MIKVGHAGIANSWNNLPHALTNIGHLGIWRVWGRDPEKLAEVPPGAMSMHLDQQKIDSL